MALTVPTRTLILDGQPVTLRGDFAALYTLEVVAGRPVLDIASDYRKTGGYRTLAQMLFAFSQGLAVMEADQDPKQAFVAWLKTQAPPVVTDFTRVANIVLDLLYETLMGQSKSESKNESEPAEEPASEESPAPSTGSGSITSSPSNGTAAEPPSGA